MDNSLGSVEVETPPGLTWSSVVRNSRGRLDMRPVKTVPKYGSPCCPGRRCVHSGNDISGRAGSMHMGNLQSIDRDIRDDNMCAVEQYQGNWERIPVTVDSGAIDSVIPRRIASGVKVKQTDASRAGLKYRSASGNAIVNEGERDLKGYSNEANRVDMTMQVAEVTKPLGSVRAFVKAGNKVVFDEGNSYIENKVTGVRTGIEDRGGAYVFDLWIPRANQGGNGGQHQERYNGKLRQTFAVEEDMKDNGEAGFAGLDDLF